MASLHFSSTTSRTSSVQRTSNCLSATISTSKQSQRTSNAATYDCTYSPPHRLSLTDSGSKTTLADEPQHEIYIEIDHKVIHKDGPVRKVFVWNHRKGAYNEGVPLAMCKLPILKKFNHQQRFIGDWDKYHVIQRPCEKEFGLMSSKERRNLLEARVCLTQDEINEVIRQKELAGEDEDSISSLQPRDLSNDLGFAMFSSSEDTKRQVNKKYRWAGFEDEVSQRLTGQKRVQAAHADSPATGSKSLPPSKRARPESNPHEVLDNLTTLTVCSNGTPAALMVLQPTEPESSQATPDAVQTTTRPPPLKATVTPIPAAPMKSTTRPGLGTTEPVTTAKVETPVSSSAKGTGVDKTPASTEEKPRTRAQLAKLQIACADCRTGHFTVKKRDQGKTLGCSSQKSIYNGITKSYTYSGCTTRVGVPVAETLWDIEEHGFDTKDATPELVCDMLNMIPLPCLDCGVGTLSRVATGKDGSIIKIGCTNFTYTKDWSNEAGSGYKGCSTTVGMNVAYLLWNRLHAHWQ